MRPADYKTTVIVGTNMAQKPLHENQVFAR